MISTLTHSIFRSVLFGSFVFCCIFFSWPQVAVAQEPAEPVSSEYVAAETFFPDSTKGFVVIRNLKELGDAWEKTQIGGLMNDPLMEAFQKDMQRSMNARMENKFGFTLDGIEKLPSGEVAAGMIAIPDKMPGFVVTMNVSDRRKETDDYLKRLSDKLTSVKVKKTTEKYKDTEIVRFTFPEAQQPAGAPTAKTSARLRNPQSETKLPPRQAFYTICMDHLLLSDQQHLIQLMIDRMTGEQTKNSLADVENFQRAMERCMEDVDGQSNPQIRWYIEPLEYGESVRTLMRGPVVEKRREKPSVFAVLKNVGFDAVKGIGGVVSIKAENKETVYRIFVYAQKPFRQAMKMLAFPDNTHFKPASWLPPDIVRCTTLYIDPLAIFDNFGPLFDNLIMQGEEGVWQDILTGLKEDVNGPQIDLREEVLVHLGQRVMSMSKYQLPITPQSECIVVAVELKEGKEQNMIDALKKLFENDPEMQSTKQGSYVLWHRIPDEDVIKPFSGPSGVPDLVPAIPTAGPARPAVDEKVEEICATITDEVVVPANYNCPGQIVISGSNAGIDKACELLLAAGAKRALKLKVGGAFHSPLMEPAKVELSEAIHATTISAPICPVYQNVSTIGETNPETIKANLIAQLTAPVKWTQSVQHIVADGATEFVELGPGNVLQGLVKKIAPEVATSGKQ